MTVCVDTPPSLTACLTGGFTYDQPPPTEPFITVDTSLAFGDSVTWGQGCRTVEMFPGVFMTRCDGDDRVAAPYPTVLRSLLAARYPQQTISVVGAGVPGECVTVSGCSSTSSSGVGRLPGSLTSSTDLVVLLQGVNDLNVGDQSVRRCATACGRWR